MMEALLRRKVGKTGAPPEPFVRLPAAYVTLEGINPGDELGVGFDGGILVIAPLAREREALHLLATLREPGRAAGQDGGART